MTLMKLSPASTRLRRMAKAYAAGEFSVAEYREARRRLIENFAPMPDDDDTQPRAVIGNALTRREPHELTPLPDPRRASPVQPAVAAEGAIRSEGPIATERETGSARSKRPRRLNGPLLTLLLLALFAVFAVHAVAEEPVVIPTVSERDPNPATSPRLRISRVSLDAPDLPGMPMPVVDARVQSALDEVRARHDERDHGFTDLELAEVGRLLQALGIHQGGELPRGAARDIQALVETQKRRRGVSVQELEEIAGLLQEDYREQGYLLTRVVLPAQTVVDGEVRLQVLPGILEHVAVSGGDAHLVAQRFADALGQPVTQELIETRLYAVNELPGLRTQAAFTAGQAVGHTRLDIEVVEQRTWTAVGQLDNHGDEDTGEERLSGSASWLNPSGRGDQLSLGALLALNPRDQHYAFLSYSLPLQRGYDLSVYAANNDFDNAAGLSLDGSTRVYEAGVTKHFRRTRATGLALEAGLASHRLVLDGASSQRSQFVTGALRGHRAFDDIRLMMEGGVEVNVGRLSSGRRDGQNDTYARLAGNWFGWKPVNVPRLPGEQKLVLGLAGQYATSQLPATLQLGLTGARANRGFDRGIAMVDTGILTSLELRTPGPLGEWYAFVDAGYGNSENDRTSAWSAVTSLGLGWDARFNDSLLARLTWALPVTSKQSGGLGDDGPQLFWSLQYAH